MLDEVCGHTLDPAEIRSSLDDLSWSLLNATLGAADRTTLNRSAKLICQHEQRMTPAHRRVAEAIKSHACPSAR
jgi:hypothetical protein